MQTMLSIHKVPTLLHAETRNDTRPANMVETDAYKSVFGLIWP